jgi:hypothetical protein
MKLNDEMKSFIKTQQTWISIFCVVEVVDMILVSTLYITYLHSVYQCSFVL